MQTQKINSLIHNVVVADQYFTRILQNTTRRHGIQKLFFVKLT